MTCTIEGCERPINGRGWCTSHYGSWRRHGNPLALTSIRPIEDIIEDIEFMAACGESPAMMAARLGTSAHALDVRLRRAGRHDLSTIFSAETNRAKTGAVA